MPCSPMHRPWARRLAAIAALLVCIFAEGSVAVPHDDEASPETLGERELLERLASHHDIVTEASGPRLGSYIRDLGTAFGESLRQLLAGWDARFEDLGGTLVRVGAETLIILSALLLLVLLARWTWRLYRNRCLTPQDAISPELPDRPKKAHLSDDDWARRLEQELAAERFAAALEALWWWLAGRLAPAAEASWTSRELIVHGGRPDLLPQVRQLDRLIYGAALPRAEDIRHLWQALREKLP